jgi:hypothetical protein
LRSQWPQNEPGTVTSCPVCDIDSFAGIDGLSVGPVLPAYGTLSRFGNLLAITGLNTNKGVGIATPFKAGATLMLSDPMTPGMIILDFVVNLCRLYRCSAYKPNLRNVQRYLPWLLREFDR